jgi:hypothetical protein
MESWVGKIARRGIWSHAGPPSLAARISTVVDFLDECPSHHPRCLQETKDHVTRILPSRFIDVGSQDRSVEPKLVSSSGISTTEKYTTLSHCWVPILKICHYGLLDPPRPLIQFQYLWLRCRRRSGMQLVLREHLISGIYGLIRFASSKMTWRIGNRKPPIWHQYTKTVSLPLPQSILPTVMVVFLLTVSLHQRTLISLLELTRVELQHPKRLNPLLTFVNFSDHDQIKTNYICTMLHFINGVGSSRK